MHILHGWESFFALLMLQCVHHIAMQQSRNGSLHPVAHQKEFSMATMTVSGFGVGKSGSQAKQAGGTKSAAVRPGIFQRVLNAVIESKRRRAEIEIRRVRAIIEDKKATVPDYALLPFAGE
jgi:KaiC/GvpD/RAD55 family RecA-like ATPase